MYVVVVESPAKAKTINKYLGSDYRVLASFGHVRDLPAKDGSVRPDDDFAMSWDIHDRAKKHIDEIVKALKGADRLYLATDPDREGEAISWHVREVLDERHALENVEVSRVVFHEVTKDAVVEAMRHPREINRELVDAYLARRALDYLVGFTLSPVLWRKLPGSRSAGRVQSVALRLICEREAEIEIFKPREYWTVDADFLTPRRETLGVRLTHLDGEKFDQFALADEDAAQRAVAAIEGAEFRVAAVERKQVKRNPRPPFTTSTLQQEASLKLRLGTGRTMRAAQRLYEGVDIGGETVGLITYMRTDSVTLAGEAMQSCRGLIERQYGAEYVPKSPRTFRNKSKNAQEAHEAIRPTDVSRLPKDLPHGLDQDQRKLYELIWRRTVACQMENAVLDQTAVTLRSADDATALRATGSVIVFDGFLRVYREGSDDSGGGEARALPLGDEEKMLPRVEEGEAMERTEVRPEQHFTIPPPRFSEASLVKRLEELGIGRPSTYASIIQVLQDRDYVRLDKRRFMPEDRGRLVTAFLSGFFARYVEYDFTADLENQLDDISNGRVAWKAVLHEFWRAFKEAVDETKELTIREVLDALDQDLGPHFFPDDGSGGNPRACPSCKEGRLGLKLGKFGAFIGCANYPDCRYTAALVVDSENGGTMRRANGETRELGHDPDNQETITQRVGPYGPYVQRGDGDKDKKQKPKRVSIPKDMDAETMTLETALKLLALPRDVGKHPETGKTISAGIGRFGPYIRLGDDYRSLESNDDVLTVGLNRAVSLLAEAKKGRRGGNTELRVIADHPDDGKPITVHNGRYGPYLRHGSVNASLPKDVGVDEIELPQAVALLEARKARVASGRGGSRKAKS